MHMHATPCDGTFQKALIRKCPLWGSAGGERVCVMICLDMLANW